MKIKLKSTRLRIDFLTRLTRDPSSIIYLQEYGYDKYTIRDQVSKMIKLGFIEQDGFEKNFLIDRKLKRYKITKKGLEYLEKQGILLLRK